MEKGLVNYAKSKQFELSTCDLMMALISTVNMPRTCKCEEKQTKKKLREC